MDSDAFHGNGGGGLLAALAGLDLPAGFREGLMLDQCSSPVPFPNDTQMPLPTATILHDPVADTANKRRPRARASGAAKPGAARHDDILLGLEDIVPSPAWSPTSHQWLSNSDIASLLINFGAHVDWFTTAAPQRPASGSVFLYHRPDVKFRRDGYVWAKRTDGKTAREDHARLRINGKDCIYGCYAHALDNPNFHRRCYWLLNNPSVVMVHYLETKHTSRRARAARGKARGAKPRGRKRGGGGARGGLLAVKPEQGLGVLDAAMLPAPSASDPFLPACDLEALQGMDMGKGLGWPPEAEDGMMLTDLDLPDHHSLGAGDTSLFAGLGVDFGHSSSLPACMAGATPHPVWDSQASQPRREPPAAAAPPPRPTAAASSTLRPSQQTPTAARFAPAASSAPGSSTPSAAVGRSTSSATAATTKPALLPIVDFSPEWSFTEGQEKLLIIGNWQDPGQYAVVFGSTCIPAVWVQAGVISCRVPPSQGPGWVYFKVMRNHSTLSYSVRFEYRSRPAPAQPAAARAVAPTSKPVPATAGPARPQAAPGCDSRHPAPDANAVHARPGPCNDAEQPPRESAPASNPMSLPIPPSAPLAPPVPKPPLEGSSSSSQSHGPHRDPHARSAAPGMEVDGTGATASDRAAMDTKGSASSSAASLSIKDITWTDFLTSESRQLFAEMSLDERPPGGGRDTRQMRLEYAAARTIQHAFRRFLNRSEPGGGAKTKSEGAARVIQQSYRRYRQMVQCEEAAVKIQSRYRGYREQAKFKQSREAVVAIQRTFRTRLSTKQKAAQTIQRFYRQGRQPTATSRPGAVPLTPAQQDAARRIIGFLQNCRRKNTL